MYESYVSSETAKILKEKGFREWCRQCYGLDVRHNSEPIDVDEEYELKDTGRENEIEYVDGGRMYDFGCDNFNPDSPYAAPTHQMALKWLREMRNIIVVVDYEYECTSTSYYYKIYRLGEHGKPERVASYGVSYDKDNNPTTHLVGWRDYERSYSSYETYEDACEAGIKYALVKYTENEEEKTMGV